MSTGNTQQNGSSSVPRDDVGDEVRRCSGNSTIANWRSNYSTSTVCLDLPFEKCPAVNSASSHMYMISTSSNWSHFIVFYKAFWISYVLIIAEVELHIDRSRVSILQWEVYYSSCCCCCCCLHIKNRSDLYPVPFSFLLFKAKKRISVVTR